MGDRHLFLDSVVKAGVGGLVDSVASLIDRFVTTPDEKTKALIELRALEVRETEAIVSSASAALKAEAESPDPWVRRARPTFLYLMYTVLAWNYILLPVTQLLTSQPLAPIVLPTDLYYLFGAGYLGYVGARTWDKTRG
jgi:hypothetical protein